MNQTLTANEIKLQVLCERLARKVCGNGIVNRAEAEDYQSLQVLTGKNWDAVNRTWETLSEDDISELREAIASR